jgi:SAM-dependent methyltransferase
MDQGMNGAARVRTRACPICGDANAATPAGPYGTAEWPIIACAGCGFVHMRVVPETEELVENLAWDKTYAAEQSRRAREQPVATWLDTHMRWRLNMFPRTEPVDLVNRLGGEAGPVVDLGCGSGGFLRRLDARFTPYGIEISAALAARASEVVEGRGGRIVADSAHDGLAAFPDGFFAGALLRSYLEHDADARAVVLMLGRKLRAGGIAALKVPNFGSVNRMVRGAKWCGIRLPDHVNYFTKASLTALAGQAGLAIRFPLMLSLPTDDNVVAILRKV